NAGYSVDDRLSRPAGAVGHDGTARSHCLQWGDAEVFDARKNERLGLRVEPGNLLVSQGSQEFDVGSRQISQPSLFLTLPDDLQRQPQLVEYFNGQVHTFVRSEGPDHQVLCRWCAGRAEPVV